MGKIFAVLAAVFNSCIGIFSNKLYDQGMDSMQIAFFRCFIAMLILSLFLTKKKFRTEVVNTNKSEILKYALLSFLGIFIMYSFEVLAIKFIPVSLVSFLLYSAGIITIVLSCIFLKENFDLKKFMSIIFVFTGVFFMFISNMSVEGNLIGLVMALTAGLGYSLFLFFMKKFNLESNLKILFYLFLFGSIYLSIPVAINKGFTFEFQSLPYLIVLAILPTIGGFYCTNKALSLIDAGKVQLFEMTEPFFASILAYFILGEVITFYDFIAGILIIIGLLILELDNIKSIIDKNIQIRDDKEYL